MCGIFGVSYGPEGAAGELWTPTELATLMFPAIVHRGPHAFGWMSFNPATGITIVKHPGKVTHARNRKRIVLDDECSWFVGHVRFATNGAPEHNVNNHPILHGRVVGVHNGVLRGWEDIIAKTGREDDSALVDSEAIFAAVNKWGDTNGLKKINGDMVAVYARTNHPDVLNIARTYGRPLVYATTAAGSLIFASECCVIDACGLETSEPTDFTGRYRRLKVKKGAIIERVQYRADTGRAGAQTSIAVPGTQRRGSGHVRGITDYFDGVREGRLLSTDPPSSASTAGTGSAGTPKGFVDEWGGVYVGAGWWRTPDGFKTASEYVTWAVAKARAVDAASRQIDDGLAAAAAEAAATAEAAAHDIMTGAAPSEPAQEALDGTEAIEATA